MSDAAPKTYPTPIIDTTLGMLSTGGDPELLSELVSIFIKMAPAQFEKMKGAIATDDSTTLRREAHSMKGAAGALGAAGIQNLAAEIENLANQGEVETARPLVDLVEGMFSQLKQEYAAKNPMT